MSQILMSQILMSQILMLNQRAFNCMTLTWGEFQYIFYRPHLPLKDRVRWPCVAILQTIFDAQTAQRTAEFQSQMSINDHLKAKTIMAK